MTETDDKPSAGKINQDHLREFVESHSRELSELALQAGQPKASALLILAASDLYESDPRRRR